MTLSGGPRTLGPPPAPESSAVPLVAQVPAVYRAIVLPPGKRNPRAALLTAWAAVEIPDAGPDLRVVARLRAERPFANVDLCFPTHRGGWVEYFAEGPRGSPAPGNFLARMETLVPRMASASGWDAFDLPLDEAVGLMSGGHPDLAARLESAKRRDWWNPFSPRPDILDEHRAQIEWAANEAEPGGRVKAAPGARDAAIAAAVTAAQSMRATPDGRVLAPDAAGPFWRLVFPERGGKPVASASFQRPTTGWHPPRLWGEPGGRVADRFRGDRAAEALAALLAVSGAAESVALDGEIEAVDRPAFAGLAWDDRARRESFASACLAFCERPPGAIDPAKAWAGRPGTNFGQHGVPWTPERAAAVLRLRNAAHAADEAAVLDAWNGLAAVFPAGAADPEVAIIAVLAERVRSAEAPANRFPTGPARG